MNTLRIQAVLLFCLISTLFLSSCATVPRNFPVSEQRAYIAEDDHSLISNYAPVFIIEDIKKTYNLIGTVRARLDAAGKEELFVDTETPAIYYEKRAFQTGKGTYTNLIYRIHFEQVPFNLVPFYLVKGKNVGIFVIVTLNEEGKPLLFTTVHTCGCYVAFVPTTYLPEEAFPKNWNKESQWVFGYTLPGLLPYPTAFNDTLRPLIFIRSGTHRIKNVVLDELEVITQRYEPVDSPLRPLENLEKIPMDSGGTTSFYERSSGYVKGSHKPFERLFMSWWTFDWRIGEDKKLGIDKEDGPLFYTSLKPWARKKSDLRDFASFLSYWGWGM